MSTAEELANANAAEIAKEVDAEKVVEDTRSGTSNPPAEGSPSLEEQYKAAKDKTDVKVMHTNVQFANADDIPKEVKDKIVEKLGDDSGKPDWTLEHKANDNQKQQRLVNNTVPKNVVIL